MCNIQETLLIKGYDKIIKLLQVEMHWLPSRPKHMEAQLYLNEVIWIKLIFNTAGLCILRHWSLLRVLLTKKP